jgi:hypothetical protein
LLAQALALAVNQAVSGAHYYVSPSGNDENPGSTPARAWRTVEKANTAILKAGDHLLFEGGKTFRGTLQLGRNVVGTINDSIVVSSYGTGRAVIDGDAGSGITIEQSEGLVIDDLIVLGSGRKSGNVQGVGVLVAGARQVRINRVEASGFQRAGIEFRGCTDIRIIGCHVHDNGYAGIASDGDRSQDVYVGYCRAINNPGDPTIVDNHSGNGIVLFNVANATIEYCEAAENGWDMPWRGNGPVGIWCVNHSDRVRIQFCISHDNKSPGYDGGGFDFDGGVTNSILQYNYSYKNKGWGYLLYEYGSQWPFRNNVMRYCISEDDGDAGIGIGVSKGAVHGFSDCQIYNNVIWNSNRSPCVNFFEGEPKGFCLRNNVFVSRDGPQVRGANKARFEGNCYWTIGGGFAVDGHTSLAQWAASSGQEMIDGVVVGLNVDPLLKSPGSRRLTDPTRLSTLLGYSLRDDSPLIDRGLELSKRFGIDPGPRDFFGNKAPSGKGFDIGVHEHQAYSPQ